MFDEGGFNMIYILGLLVVGFIVWKIFMGDDKTEKKGRGLGRV